MSSQGGHGGTVRLSGASRLSQKSTQPAPIGHTAECLAVRSEMKEGAREHCAVQKTMSQNPDKGSRQAAVEGLMQ